MCRLYIKDKWNTFHIFQFCTIYENNSALALQRQNKLKQVEAYDGTEDLMQFLALVVQNCPLKLGFNLKKSV